MKLVDGIQNENSSGFVGKDGFFWWVGEVEDNEDPMELGRVKVRVLGYYTNLQGGTIADLPTHALPWATVLQNVAFGLRARGVPKKEREKTALHYIREVGLLGFEDKYPHQLSGGMRQRTGLARALTINSDILLMDEPFSAVDEQMRRKLQEDLLNLLRIENKTVIFVTHSIEEAVYLADQVVILSGRPGSIADIVYPEIDRRGEIDLIRRQARYMELVDEIWSSLKRYVE